MSGSRGIASGSGPAERRIAVAMTCFNRRTTTLACLASLSAQNLPAGCSVDLFLTDDGCTDGTGNAVRERFPATHVIKGDGTLYWNGGMRRALAAAMAGNYDFYLWLNDDTTLDRDAVAKLLSTYDDIAGEAGAAAIVVGCPANPEGGPPLYGGAVPASRWRPMRFERLSPADAPVACATFNGNCVLVSKAAADRLGNLDPAFVQPMGDTDYGLRATRAGIPIRVAPGTIGSCPGNPGSARHLDPRVPLRDRFAWLLGTKGLPPKQWMVLTRRHGGPLWPVFWASPYVRFTLGILLEKAGTALGRKPPDGRRH